jgi:hypothetical protein
MQRVDNSLIHADTVLSIAANACSADTINPSNYPDLSTDSNRSAGSLPASSIAEGEHPMNGASKILTVSYGTFSCTLEGFDDPFNTMKAIAEYFRDLAAEDRYFGAEPPTPDAAMLHRIAEREIQRRVEAKIQDNGVILRAGDVDTALAAPAPAPQPTLAEADVASENVAARLQRIRAKHKANKASKADEAAAVAAPAIIADAYIEDQHAEDISLPASLPDAEPLSDIPDQLEQILDQAEVDQSMIEDAIQPDATIESAFEADADFELATTPEPIDDASFDEESADPLLDTIASELADAPAEEIDAIDIATSDDAMLASLGAIAPSEEAVEETSFDDDFADELDEGDLLEEAAPAKAELPDTPAFDEDAFLARLTDEEPELPAASPAEERPAAMDQDILDDMLSAVEPAVLTETVDQTETMPAASAPEADAAPAPRARARVIRIRRVDPAAETAPSAATLAAIEAEFQTGPTTAAAAPASGIPAYDDSVIATEPRQDSSVNRLIAQANTEMDDEATLRRQSAIAHLKAAVAATEADRRMTNGAGAEPEKKIEAYRSDLDRVVRPRRPVSSQAAAKTAASPTALELNEQRTTPLVLVSAQRIDRSPATTAEAASRVVMPVRPRRPVPVAAAPVQNDDVNSAPPVETATARMIAEADQIEQEDEEFAMDGADNVFSASTSFQDFADQLGATSLPDLMEAAAVYCAEVLQRPEFSRPLVMRQLSGLPGQSENEREDYLRGFGTLLRQGRITKVKRGMFALTDRSPYLAEARKAAG